ncbi:MAG: DUF1553 domain-containing protein [Verrucomicrobia bacterium]|nr:DUF1553 domain-containing protein [Verrucomicrobiota bacterium]
MRDFIIALVVGWGLAGQAAAPVPESNPYESPVAPRPQNRIDRFVFARLSALGLHPVLCSDAVFVRRAYLDVIGTLPTAEEARDFIGDPDARHKRSRLIDRLLGRDEFADYWAMKWGDLLRIKAEFPVNLWPNAAQAYHRWVRAAIAANEPYDRFVGELLTASGSNFRVGPVNFYRAVQNRTPEGLASAVALTFMGVRAEAWPTSRLAGMAVCFSQVGYKPTGEWKEEHVFWDPLGASRVPGDVAPGRDAIATVALASERAAEPAKLARATGPPTEASLPDGTRLRLPPDRDPREVFADWLIRPGNPWFTRNIVNRVWAWLLGRGIIQEPDDLRADNPPSNPALLGYLEKEMIAGHYDLKRLYRLILNSATYQLSSVPRFNTPEAAANFASYALRRLDAEVLIDAIDQVTGASDLYTSPIPEPFTYLPAGQRAIAIADGSITSPFLALFGRSARATGLENERDNNPVPGQWLDLLNSTHIQRKLQRGPKLEAIINSSRGQSEITAELYLTLLSRFPTPAELRAVAAYGRRQPNRRMASANPNRSAVPPRERGGAELPPGRAGRPRRPAGVGQGTGAGPSSAGDAPPALKRREDWIDIAWSLMNSTEFLYRH